MVNVVNISNDANLVALPSERVEEFQKTAGRTGSVPKLSLGCDFLPDAYANVDWGTYSASMSPVIG